MTRMKVALVVLMALALASAATEAAAQTLDTLTSFAGPGPRLPRGDFTVEAKTLYATSMNGGSDGLGTVFRLPTNGGTPTTLSSFDGTGGNLPDGNLTYRNGVFYGTTYAGERPVPTGRSSAFPLREARRRPYFRLAAPMAKTPKAA